jgi:SAM-dependent methyltransferase
VTAPMSSFDNERAQEFVRTRQEFIGQFLKSIRTTLALETAVDVGCGVGYLSKFLSEQGFEVLGIEGREENTDEARHRAPGIRFITRDVEDMSLSQVGVFDLTLCAGLLYHLENPFRAIRNLYAMTRKIAIIESMCVPGREPEMLLLDEGRENNQGLRYIAFCPTEACLIKMLAGAGFPYVYRFKSFPADEDFRGTLVRKRLRTMLLASKLPVASEELVSAEELKRWQFQGPHPWRTAVSHTTGFFVSKFASARGRLQAMARNSNRPGPEDGR